jgi:hypothetical protein
VSSDTESSHPPRRNRLPGKQTITREVYDQLLDAFRTEGENYKAVAARVGVHWSTAKRGYVQGWADQKSKPWALPIRDVLKREQIEARAALEREKKALVNDRRIARQQSLQDAIESSFADIVDSRAKRGKVIRGARDNSLAALIVSQKMLKAAIPLADKITQSLETEDLDVFQRMRLLRSLGRFAHDAIEMSQTVDEMERKALGEPDTILEVQHGITMDLDEAKETLAEVAEVLGMYEEGDVEDVIDAEWAEKDGTLAVTDDDAEDDQPEEEPDDEPE